MSSSLHMKQIRNVPKDGLHCWLACQTHYLLINSGLDLTSDAVYLPVSLSHIHFHLFKIVFPVFFQRRNLDQMLACKQNKGCEL